MDGETNPVDRKISPWGPFTTVAFTLLVFAVFLLLQIVLAVPYLIIFKVAGSSYPDFLAAVAGLESDGFFVGLTELIAGPLAIGLILFLTWLRKGSKIRDYLALTPVPRLMILRWLLYTALIGLLLDGMSHAAGYPVVSDWMLSLYRSAAYPPLLLFALLVVAPILEELLFRGFLFEGMRHSRIGDTGTILLASLLWASVHLQYEWFYIGQIFVLGLLLGAARIRTRSVIAPILMHSLISGIATLQVILKTL